MNQELPFIFTFVGDEHPKSDSRDLPSRGANYIISNDLLQLKTGLFLEFLCADKGHQKVIDDFILPNSQEYSLWEKSVEGAQRMQEHELFRFN